MTNSIQICLSKGWGGQEMFPLSLARELTRLGHPAAIVARRGGRLLTQAREAELVTLELAGLDYFDPRLTLQLRRALSVVAEDTVIHVHRSRDLWHVVPALRGRRNPLLMTNHMGSPPKRDPLHGFLHQRVDAFISVNPNGMGEMIRNWRLPPDKVWHLPPGVDTERFRPDPTARERVRREMAIPSKRRVAILVGQIDPRKGQREFVEAILHLASEGREIEGWVVGRATPEHQAYLDDLQARAAGSAKPEAVRFLGFRQHVPDLLNAADVAVVASWHEAFGMTVVEAWAVGQPVAAARAGSFVHLVREGETGIFFEVRSAEDLASALTRLTDDPEAARRMGDAGRARVEREFSLVRVAERHLELYGKVE